MVLTTRSARRADPAIRQFSTARELTMFVNKSPIPEEAQATKSILCLWDHGKACDEQSPEVLDQIEKLTRTCLGRAIRAGLIDSQPYTRTACSSFDGKPRLSVWQSRVLSQRNSRVDFTSRTFICQNHRPGLRKEVCC